MCCWHGCAKHHRTSLQRNHSWHYGRPLQYPCLGQPQAAKVQPSSAASLKLPLRQTITLINTVTRCVSVLATARQGLPTMLPACTVHRSPVQTLTAPGARPNGTVLSLLQQARSVVTTSKVAVCAAPAAWLTGRLWPEGTLSLDTDSVRKFRTVAYTHQWHARTAHCESLWCWSGPEGSNPCRQ